MIIKCICSLTMSFVMLMLMLKIYMNRFTLLVSVIIYKYTYLVFFIFNYYTLLAVNIVHYCCTFTVFSFIKEQTNNQTKKKKIPHKTLMLCYLTCI